MNSPTSRRAPEVQAVQPFLPPPSPELSPTIFGRAVSQRQVWIQRVITLLLFNWLTVFGVVLALRPDAGTGETVAGLVIAILCFAASIQSIRGSERRRVRAGRDWISENGEGYARFDKVAQVGAFRNVGNNWYVRFIQFDGSGVNLPASVIQRNRMLHRIISEALTELEGQGRNVFESPEDRREFYKRIEPYDSRPYEADDHP